MDKIRQLEIKKLIKELSYVESEYSYKNEIVNEIEGLFIKSVNDFLDENPDIKEAFDNKINQKIDNIFNEKKEQSFKDQEEVNFLIEEELQEQENKVDATFAKLKKLYRKIVKITHPDIITNKKLNELYLRATKYYELLDMPGTLLICEELGLDFEVDDNDLDSITRKITKLKDGINFMESTLTWLWYKSEESEKKKILLGYIRARLEN